MEPIPGIRAVLSQAQTAVAVKAEKGASAGDRGDAASNCSARGGVGSFVSDATRTAADRRRRDTASREADRLLRPWSAASRGEAGTEAVEQQRLADEAAAAETEMTKNVK